MTHTHAPAALNAPRLADHLALDLLNTVVEVDGGTVDCLSDDRATRAWLRDSGLAVDPVPSAPDGQTSMTDALCALREEIRLLVESRIHGQRADPARLNAWLAEGSGHWVLEWKRGARLPQRRWHYERDGLASTLAPLAEAAAELLSWPDFSGVKHCENPACRMVFHDPSATRRRRWCDMAICGNRMKVQAFRERKRQAGAAAG
jgi:predicted RNA-binding Zn ribbon-like protein